MQKINNKQDHRSRSAKPTTIHGCAQSGDLAGFQKLLRDNPSLLNDRNPVFEAKMAPDPKRRKVDDAVSRRASSSLVEKKDIAAAVPNRPTAVQTRGVHPRIQQAKDYAVAQAQQEGCTGNFKIFDSPFGNFLVPLISTRAELGG